MITTPDTPGNPGHNFTISATSVAFTGERGYSVLHSFDNYRDGAYPRAALSEGSDGWIYGTTPVVGNQNAGTIFTLNKDGSNYSVLYRFSNSGTGGRSPRAGLLKASNGVFLGTTSNGGDFQN